MFLGNRAQEHLAVDAADESNEPFLAAEKLEQANVKKSDSPRRHGLNTGYILIFSTLCCLTVIAGLLLTVIVMSMVKAPWAVEYDLKWLFASWRKPSDDLEDTAQHSTTFLHSVIPRPCHSHNDYWRKVPVYSALEAGCTGIEADIWSFGDNPELFIGHERAALTPRRTFQSLYVNPLVKILEERNAGRPVRDGKSHRGVFGTYPEQTLVLLVDIKTNGAKALERIQAQLAPLRDRDWLTHVEDGVLHKRQVTVVGTGHTPFDLLTQNSTYQDVFFDAPLNKLYEDPDMPETRDNSPEISVYNTTNSFYASVNFRKAIGFVWSRLSERQLRLIRGQIRGAHKRGLKVRYWNTPSWPISLRDRIWDTLIAEGADLLNVDNLEDVAKKWEIHTI